MKLLFEIPATRSEVHVLPIHVKPDWQGPIAYLLGLGMWLGERINVVAGVLWGWTTTAFLFGSIGLGITLAILALIATVLAYRDIDVTCTYAMDHSTQMVSGRIYAARGRNLREHPIDDATMLHEGLHDWLARKFGRVVFAVRIALQPEWRLHNEGMAYGAEVALFGLPVEEAVDSIMKPLYFGSWDRAHVRDVVRGYAARFAKWEA